MNCILLFTIITLNATDVDNTMPRAWQLGTYATIEQCEQNGQSRPDFNKWRSFSDAQGSKMARSECVCFER